MIHYSGDFSFYLVFIDFFLWFCVKILVVLSSSGMEWLGSSSEYVVERLTVRVKCVMIYEPFGVSGIRRFTQEYSSVCQMR